MAQTPETKHPLSANEQEIAILKEAFADNEPTLKAIRSLFLGFPLSKPQIDLIQAAFKNPSTKEAFRNKMYYTMSPDSEIGELSDFWFGTDTQLVGRSIEEINQVVASKDLINQKFIQAFNLIDDPTGDPVDMSFDVSGVSDPYQVRLLARNGFIKSVETGLTIVKVIAGQRAESVDKAKKRLDTNSTK